MAINQGLSDAANESSLWQKAIRAQFAFLRDELDHYLTAGERMERLVTMGTANLMPHQWGSIDSYDDMRAALNLAKDLFDQAFDAPSDEEQAREELREAIVDRNAGAASEVRELAFEGWDEDHIETFLSGGAD